MSRPNTIETIMARCTRNENGCLVWPGSKTLNGYGEASINGRRGRVHRLVYEHFHGPIPDGYDVCHSCDTRACIEPSHLWAGSRKENMEDCVKKGRHDSLRRTHCPRGHEYTPENTRWKKPNKWRPAGARECVTCNRLRQRLLAGWPRHLAESMSAVRKGTKPINANWKAIRMAVSSREDDSHE